ncbi:Ureidoglycolate lyase [compost metagenome]
MKFVSHLQNGKEQSAVLLNGKLYNTNALDAALPNTMMGMLDQWESNFAAAKKAVAALEAGSVSVDSIDFDAAHILAPVPRPTSCRDGYAFRQHVAAARRNRGVEMIAEFDQYPIFYFTNHNAVQGPGAIDCMPDHFDKLDFELEVAVVVGKKGRNITAAEADDYVAGYCIMNDMSARTLQMEEMLLNLGPAKGKDFSTVIGPWMITPDELEAFKIPAKPNHTGNNYNLKMTCKVNGIQVSEGNVGDMDWTFAEILERCAYGADILPGDVIGSGTVGTGCFLELNGTAKLNNPDAVPQWLQPNDEVVLEVEQMGVLTNTINAVDTDFSILKLKKK